MGRVRIGISGWNYAGWRGTFYPAGLPAREHLAYAAGRFPTIEVNGTFYSLQRPRNFTQWYAASPPQFVFAIKGSRYITHMKRLKDVKVPLANFFASGVLRLKEKLGPFLWQFPAAMRYDRDRLAAFLDMLPRDTEQASRLARRHDQRVSGRAAFAADRRRRIRHAVEVRHDSFACDDFISLLRRNGIALVVSDAGPHWPMFEDVTAGFMYVRLHGALELYASGYDDRSLAWWNNRIRMWTAGRQPSDARTAGSRKPPARDGRDVYVYFDNDAKVQAPKNAMRLAEMVNA